jgi:hypothetical protein
MPRIVCVRAHNMNSRHRLMRDRDGKLQGAARESGSKQAPLPRAAARSAAPGHRGRRSGRCAAARAAPRDASSSAAVGRPRPPRRRARRRRGCSTGVQTRRGRRRHGKVRRRGWRPERRGRAWAPAGAAARRGARGEAGGGRARRRK